MSELYRKRGRVVRYESGTIVRIDEAGESVEDIAGVFTASPLGESVGLPEPEAAGVLSIVERIAELIPASCFIERLLISDGIAEHECGGARWRETTRRIHLAIARRSIRALVDLGSFELGDVARIAEALGRLQTEPESHRSSVLRLAPNVSAAVLSSLIGLIDLWQTAAPRDGKGIPIADIRLRPGMTWPNWYRPSYRVRPIRMPLHLRARHDSRSIDRSVPIAVALLAPPEGQRLRVLVDDGERTWPLTVQIDRVTAIGDPVAWYPYGGGAFGAELMLEGAFLSSSGAEAETGAGTA